MAIPEPVKREVIQEVKAFCDGRVPSELRDEIRIEFSVRGNAITIVERRPPWREDFGPDWSSLKVAQLRYDSPTGSWTLYWRNRNERWFRYPDADPSNDIRSLLNEIDADPTGIFWG